jgi:hypothetical protein
MSKHWGVSVRVFRRARTIGFTFMLLLVAGAASAGEKEPAAVLELGAASTWDVGGGFTFGPSAALEFEPIKNDLVIEAGFTPFFDKGGRAPVRPVEQGGVRARYWTDVGKLWAVRRAGVL